MSILALASDTLIVTPASGNLEYNGQFFGTDSAGSRAQLQRIVQGTAVASTSGTSIDFTSIPSWVKKITVMLNGVSTSGTSIPLIQLGDSGGIEITGYSAVAGAAASAGTWGTSTAGFPVGASSISTAANLLYGSMIFTTLGSNAWVGQGSFYASSGYSMSASGAKSTSATLDRVRITTVNGTDTFDAGTINIIYEG
jgi:hypothetical protein